MRPHSCCHFCGSALEQVPFPRKCSSCSHVIYLNPTPVVVLVVPVGPEKLLAVRRDIEPAKGKLALPSGYVDAGETWEAAACRELKEETGIDAVIDEVGFYQEPISSLRSNTVLLFCVLPAIEELPAAFEPNEEVTELVAVGRDLVDELAWPAHQVIATEYLNDQRPHPYR